MTKSPLPLLLVLLAVALSAGSFPLRADIFVAPDGDDTNGGTETAPFATLERARQEVRGLNAAMSADLIVQIGPGTYPVTAPVVFDENDSGMNGHEVVYRCAGDPGAARFIGAQPVTNWQPHEGEIMMADLGLPAFHTLYENGRRARKARFPNLVPDPELPLARADYLRATGVAGSHRQLQYGAAALDPTGWDLSEAQVHLWPGGKWAWFTDTVPIATIDPATRVITLAEETRYDIHQNGVGSRFFLQGLLDLLDEPGEFHYDSSAGRLYYWPMDGPASTQEIMVPRVTEIVALQGSSDTQRVRDLRFEGLAFELTDFTGWFRHAHVSAGDSGESHLYPQYDRQMTLPQHRTGAVHLANTDHLTFDACVVRNTGYSGFYAFGHNQHNTFQRCLVSHVGVHGFSFEGRYPGEGDVQRDNTVDNCLIHDVGELAGHGAGVQLTNAGHHEVSHCVIFNSPRYAVTMPAYVDIPIGDIYVQGNNIHHVRIQRCCQDSGDTAPIYAWGISDDPPYLSNTFEQLLIDDTRAHASMTDFAPNGVFLDNDTNGQNLTDIEVRNSQWNAYRTNGSSNQTLTNVSWQAGFDPARMDYDTIGVRADHPFPVPPIRLAGEIGASGLEMSWLPVANAVSYTLYGAPTPDGPWGVVADGLTMPFATIPAPPAQGTTFYQVTSTGPGGQESLPSFPSISVCTTRTGTPLAYTTGLDVWLDASDIDGSNNSTLTDGDPVAIWKNKGTTGVNDAIAILSGGSGGANGVFVACGGNGPQDAVQLNNTRYQFGQEFMDSPNVTAYFVVKRTGSGQGALINDYGDGSELWLLNTNLNPAPGNVRNYFRDAGGDIVSNTPAGLALDTWETVFAAMDSTVNTTYFGFVGGTIGGVTNIDYDPTTWSATDSGGTSRRPTLFGFHDGNNTHDFNGFVSEVLIYDHILSPADQATVEAYLLAKSTAPPDPDEFRITDVSFNVDGDIEVTVTGLVTTKEYVMTRSAYLQDGFPVTAFGPFTPTSTIETVVDPDPPDPAAFYRIEQLP